MAETERLDGRDGKIWCAYVSGVSQEAIAAEHGISQQRVSQVLAEVRDSIGDVARMDAALLAQERADALLAAVWPAARAGDTKAVLAALRVLERQARAMGTDAAEPIAVTLGRRLDVEGDVVVDALTAALEVLQLGEGQRQLAVQAAVARLNGEPLPEPSQLVVEESVVDPEQAEREREFRRLMEADGVDADALLAEGEDDQDEEEDGGV